MKCGVCKAKDSTGVMIAMCDGCLTKLEAKSLAAKIAGKKYRPTDNEVQAINDGIAALRMRSTWNPS
jgi:hypothetical protein